MYEGYACSGRPVRLARISCHVRQIPKWHLKGTRRLFTRFLHCVEVSHNLGHLDELYRGARVNCNF